MKKNTIKEVKKVIIIGAGPAGQSAATELSNNKINTTIIEKQRQLGV